MHSMMRPRSASLKSPWPELSVPWMERRQEAPHAATAQATGWRPRASAATKAAKPRTKSVSWRRRPSSCRRPSAPKTVPARDTSRRPPLQCRVRPRVRRTSVRASSASPLARRSARAFHTPRCAPRAALSTSSPRTLHVPARARRAPTRTPECAVMPLHAHASASRAPSAPCARQRASLTRGALGVDARRPRHARASTRSQCAFVRRATSCACVHVNAVRVLVSDQELSERRSRMTASGARAWKPASPTLCWATASPKPKTCRPRLQTRWRLPLATSAAAI